MTASKRDTSNSAIYDRLDSLRLEVKQDISVAVNTVAQSQGRLEKKFDDLEAGRLTRAEGNIQDLRVQILQQTDNLKTNQAVIGSKIVIIWALCSAMLSILGGAFVSRLLR